ncbi:MAG TPA: hypothetical protein VK489_13180 [Ferruginibacter sp.]|nr:hypothetical protein [Ferruginibacter sp.]
MPELSLAEIELAGENHVELWLARNGYTNIEKEILPSKETEIKATGTVENILVQMRTFLEPHRPFKLSEYAIDKFTRRAVNLSRVAYIAYIVIDNNKDLVGEINWERLS